MTQGVIYARVSSDEQAKTGYSIDEQLKGVRALLAREGIEPVRTFSEVHSAKQEGRPIFQEMVGFLLEHPQVRVVGVDKQDRLSRNHIDLGIIRDRLGCKLLSVKDPTDDSPEGHFMQDLNLAFAAHYSRNLAREVRKGLRGKFEAGGFVSKAPRGYHNIPRTKTTKATIVIDEEMAAHVRWAFETYATGRKSIQDIREGLFDRGVLSRRGLPLSDEQVRQMLRNPFYSGLTRYNGETRPGNHPAIIDAALFDQVQRTLVVRGKDHGEKGSKFFLLRGVLACGHCGRRMTAEDHPKGSYYRCLPDAGGNTCRARYVPVLLLDKKVESLLPAIQMTEAARSAVEGALAGLADEHIRLRESERSQIDARIEAAAAKITRLTDAFATGDIDLAAFKQLRQTYDAERRSAEERNAFLLRDIDGDIATVRQLLATAGSIAWLYELAPTREEKKEVLFRIFARIEVTDRELTHIEYQSPFHLLLGDSQAGSSGESLETRLLRCLAAQPS